MQPSTPWKISASAFVIKRTAIIHSLKCTVPFSLVVPLLSLSVTHCYLLSLLVTRCITCCHSLSLFAPLVFTCCHSLSLVVPVVVTRFVVTRCTTRTHSLYYSLSLDVPLVCLFINNLWAWLFSCKFDEYFQNIFS